jgi:hypothetical protein
MAAELPSEAVGADRGRRDQFHLLSGGEGIITGTVVCAAVIAAGAGHTDSIRELSVAMIGTITVYWLAHLHAVAIGGAVNKGHHPLLALRHAAGETWTIAAASLVPLAILLLAHLAGAELSTAAWIALLSTIGLLAVYSFVAGRRGGLGLRGSLVCSVAGAALGILVALLKAALH